MVKITLMNMLNVNYCFRRILKFQCSSDEPIQVKINNTVIIRQQC